MVWIVFVVISRVFVGSKERGFIVFIDLRAFTAERRLRELGLGMPIIHQYLALCLVEVKV